MADENNNHPIGTEGKIIHVTPDDLLRQMKTIMDKQMAPYPQIAYVVIIAPRNDPSEPASYGSCGPNLGKEILRGLLRKLSMGKGRIHTPFRD